MGQVKNILPSHNLVKYMTTPSQTEHQFYIPESDAPESIPFLLRNGVLVEFTPIIMECELPMYSNGSSEYKSSPNDI